MIEFLPYAIQELNPGDDTDAVWLDRIAAYLEKRPDNMGYSFQDMYDELRVYSMKRKDREFFHYLTVAYVQHLRETEDLGTSLRGWIHRHLDRPEFRGSVIGSLASDLQADDPLAVALFEELVNEMSPEAYRAAKGKKALDKSRVSHVLLADFRAYTNQFEPIPI